MSASTCSWTSYSWLFGSEKCDEPATRVITTGCVHEHVVGSLTCDGCVDLVKRSLEKGLLCTPCRDAGAANVAVSFVSDEPLTAAVR